MPLNFDTSTWPMWAILILVSISALQKPLGLLLPESVRDFFNRWARKQEHDQAIKESLLEHQFNTEDAKHLRGAWREDQFAEMLRQKDSYLHEYLDEKVDRIVAEQIKMLERLNAIDGNTKRTNNLLTTIHVELSGLVEAMKSLRKWP